MQTRVPIVAHVVALGAALIPACGDDGTPSGAGRGGIGGAGEGCAGCGALEECYAGERCVAKSVVVPGGCSIDATETTRSQYEAWLKTNPQSTTGQPAYCSANAYAPYASCVSRQSVARDGWLVVVIPGAGDQAELREAVLGQALESDRAARSVEMFAGDFELVRTDSSKARIRLDNAGLQDLFAGSYRGVRPRERQRLEAIGPLDVTISYDILSFRAKG